MNKPLIVILIINGFLLITVAFDSIGASLPLLRQVTGFISLTFIPGFLILQCLWPYQNMTLERVLYSIGLSLFSIMFLGFILNLFLPLMSVSKPLSVFPAVALFSTLTFFLLLVAFRKTRDTPITVHVIHELKMLLSIYLVIFPLMLSIIGAQYAAVYKSSMILLMATFFIALVAIVVAWGKFETNEIYPLAIFAFSLSLLYQVTLNGPYLSGFSDIHCEYYFYQRSFMNGYWDLTIADMYNAMLSVSILPTMYSLIANIDGLVFFKVIYPLIFSLMPVTVYAASTKLLDKRGSFLASFFLISFFGFYSEIIFILKEGIASLFVALCLLVMVDKNMPYSGKTSILLIFFVFAIVVSHYTTTYLYIFFLFCSWLILKFQYKLTIRFWKNFKSQKQLHKWTAMSHTINIKLTGTLVALFFISSLNWHLYVSNSSVFNAILSIGERVFSNISTDFLNPAARGRNAVLGGVGLGLPATTWLNQVNRWLFHITQVFIIIGMCELVWKHEELEWPPEYLALSLSNLFILLCFILLPYLNAKVSITRVFTITLISLATLCILGGRFVLCKLRRLNGIKYVFRRRSKHTNSKRGKANLHDFPLIIVLILFFLFQTGFAFVIGGQPVELNLRPINLTNIEKYANYEQKATYYNMIGYAFESDVLSAHWLAQESEPKARIFGDLIAVETVLISALMYERASCLAQTTPIKDGDYIYLRYVNTKYNLISLRSKEETHYDFYPLNEFTPLIERCNKIYTNGDSDVWIK